MKTRRLAVGVGSSPSSLRLVEWTAGLAGELGAEWQAIHVDGGAPLGVEDRERLKATLERARSLGGQILTSAGADVAESLVDAARGSGVSMLVIGRSGLAAQGRLPGRAMISDRVLRKSAGMDVVVVSDSPESGRNHVLGFLKSLFSTPLRQYLLIALSFLTVTGVCLAAMPAIGSRGVHLLYLAAILLLSLFSRPAPMLILAVASSLAYDFFFIAPRFTFAIASLEDILVFLLYFLVAAVTAFLSSGLRLREALLTKRDKVASILLSASESFSRSRTEGDAAGAAAALVERYTGSPALVCVKAEQGRPDSFHPSGLDAVEALDIEAAKLCLRRGEPAGSGSGLFPKARFRFVPAKAGRGTVASIGYAPSAKREKIAEEDALLESLGKSLAIAIEKARSDEASRRTSLELESERLAKVLFDSVSHELKTPLTAITGSLSALKDEEIGGNPSSRSELLECALESAGRLDGVVEDFLSIGRMESGRLRLRLEPIEATVLAEAIRAGAKASLAGRSFSARLPEGDEEFLLDASLAIRLGINLVDNACRYSKPGGSVELVLSAAGGGLSLLVRDEGPGYSEDRMRAPFVKFRRAEGDRPGRLGVGLALCKGIAEAHGGRMEARKREGGFEVEAFFPRPGKGEVE